MKIGLVSALMRDNALEEQIGEIEKYIKSDHKCDILAFGESFIQGFEGLSWDYEEDLKRALSLEDPEILRLRALAREYETGLSFGFIERDGKLLYSSNLFIGQDGEIVNLFRRVSEGWKEPIASEEYREGSGFHSFKYRDKTFATAICGDLWHDEFLEEIKKLDVDLLLWPLYIDFSLEDWERERYEYARRVEGLNWPVLMINSYVEEESRANGGAYIFKDGQIEKALEMGNTGILEYEI